MKKRKKKFKRFVWRHSTVRRDVMDLLNTLASIYDQNAKNNITKCKECDKSSLVYSYFFAEGKTYKNVAKDLRDMAETFEIK